MIDIQIEHRFPDRAGGFHLNIELAADVPCLAFFGNSGSGKSLTLQAIAGLFTPQQGHVRLGGRTLFDSSRKICLPVRGRRLGYLFQDYALFPHLTVRQNIAFALGRVWFGLQSGRIGRRIDEMLDCFELVCIADQYPFCISGGQRQRVALARALAAQPDMLLLDEPFSALDPLLRSRVRAQCKEIMARFAIPAILITHDPADVADLAGSVALYEKGRVLACHDVAGLHTKTGVENELLQALVQALRVKSFMAGLEYQNTP